VLFQIFYAILNVFVDPAYNSFLYLPDITCLKKWCVMWDDSFEVVVHHGGLFKQHGPINYIGGETTVWGCDPDRWSYFEVIGEIREMGYVNVKELWYAIENAMYKLEDDKSAINMMHITKHYGQVHMFVVHGISEAEVVENDLEDQQGLLCGAELESGEGSHINAEVQEVEEVVQKEVEEEVQKEVEEEVNEEVHKEVNEEVHEEANEEVNMEVEEEVQVEVQMGVMV